MDSFFKLGLWLSGAQAAMHGGALGGVVESAGGAWWRLVGAHGEGLWLALPTALVVMMLATFPLNLLYWLAVRRLWSWNGLEEKSSEGRKAKGDGGGEVLLSDKAE